MIFLFLLRIVSGFHYDPPRINELDELEAKTSLPIPQRFFGKRSDCSIIVEIWLSLGKSSELSKSVKEHECCAGRSDIPGVTCIDSIVTKMYVSWLIA
jgi:hypothetical protein